MGYTIETQEKNMVRNIKVITTDIKNPWINLALEEHFLSQSADTICLFLWQNRDTVVIGRNQNPWTECNLILMEEDNIRLARRITGGGAAFHDKGNLNFSFILSREEYDVKKQYQVILNAIRSLGIEASVSGSNDLTVDGKKFSTNAFGFKGRNALHHGTLLICSDTDKMSRYLTVPTSKLKAKTKGVSSVKNRVVNLAELNPDLTIEKVKDAVVNAFEDVYGQCREHIHLSKEAKCLWPRDDTFRRLVTRNSSWEWCYGEAPDYDMTFKNRFSWGGVEFCFRLEGGLIKKAEVFSDALCEELIGRLPEIFIDEPLSGKNLSHKLNKYKFSLSDLIKDSDSKDLVLDDLASWFLGVP